VWPFLYLSSLGRWLWGGGGFGKHSITSYFAQSLLKIETNRLTKQSKGQKLCIDFLGKTKYINNLFEE